VFRYLGGAKSKQLPRSSVESENQAIENAAYNPCFNNTNPVQPTTA